MYFFLVLGTNCYGLGSYEWNDILQTVKLFIKLIDNYIYIYILSLLFINIDVNLLVMSYIGL